MKKHVKPLGQAIWFKILLTILVFLPPFTRIEYDPANTAAVIKAVMQQPLIELYPWFLPLAKWILFMVICICFLNKRLTNQLIIIYYTVILILVGVFQNMAFTKDYGFIWLAGNTFVQFAVAGCCLYDIIKGKTVIRRENLNEKRLWVIGPMLLSFLMPYTFNQEGYVQFAVNTRILYNESGVTYCMITPMILGVLLLFSKGVYKPTISVIAYTGLIFGILNMITWFGMMSENWWMGVLHLPLLVLSFFGLVSTPKPAISHQAAGHSSPVS